MVVGGPKVDCPTSASTMAICRSRAKRLLANHVRKVVFPVSVAPRSMIVRARWRSSSAALQVVCSVNIATAYTFPSLGGTIALLAAVAHNGRFAWMHHCGGVGISHLTATGGVCMGDGSPDTGLQNICRKLR